jgi:hypothetical protein
MFKSGSPSPNLTLKCKNSTLARSGVGWAAVAWTAEGYRFAQAGTDPLTITLRQVDDFSLLAGYH